MKREFALDEAMRMLEVLWASLPASPPPNGELPLVEIKFPPSSPPPPSPSIKNLRENAYTKVCAIRRQSSSTSICGSARKRILSDEPIRENTITTTECLRYFYYTITYFIRPRKFVS